VGTDGQLSFDDLWRQVRRGFKLPLTLAVIFAVCTCVYLRVTTPLYEAKITITQRAAGDDIANGSKLLDLGALGGLAGSKRLTNYDRLIAVLISNDTAADFMAHGELMARFFPSKWNTEGSGSWRQPTGFAASIRAALNRYIRIPSWTAPGTEPVLGLFDRRVRITANDGGRSHTISFYSAHPQTAYEALGVLLRSSDKILRRRGQKASTDKLSFLRQQLSDEKLVEVRTALAIEMGKEFVTSSMLAGQTTYSFEVLKDQSVSTTPAWPRPLLSLAIAVVAGVFIGSLVIISRARSGRR
jgi:Chain length determinant protein